MGNRKTKKHRILAFLMAFLMVFTMIPTSAFAAENGEKVNVSLQGIHSAQISSMKLYSYEDKEAKKDNLLENVELTGGSAYNLELAPGDYWVDGYDSNNYLNGGIKITVTESGTNTFYIQRVYEMYCSNSGWVDGTDYTVSAKVVSSDSEVREITLGNTLSWGKERTTCLFIKGDTITATFTPIGEKTEKYIEGSVTKSAVTINTSISGSLNEAMELSFKVPAGSTVDVGKTIRNNYYTQEFYTPVKEAESNEDGTETWTFRISKESSSNSMGPYHFYRVENPDGVTYWNFFNASGQTENLITLTEDDLFIGDDNFDKNTIIKDYSENRHDTAGIYMNINAQGYKSMKSGETYELNMFRNWQAIEHFYNRMIALPDMHYEIIPLEGEDVISIEADKKISSVATMTAKNEGTAIVLVTYDAMYSTQAMTNYDNNDFYKPSKFSAIWPEFTGVFVVTVDKDGTAIETGMTIDRQGKDGMLDAEHDILFYTEENGASYSFIPEEGSVVTVNRSVVDDTKMSFEGFTSDQVTTAEDGTVTVSGLTTGRHIIKVEKDGLANYQVVTARQMSYELQDAEGNKLTENDEIKANDIIYVQFSGLVNPCEKMAGIYNHAAIVQYLGEDDAKYVSTPGGAYGVYDFSSDASEQRVKVQIPKYWTGDTYTLVNGVINMKTSGSAPASHRAVRYATGTAANYDAVQGIGTLLCELPDIELSIAKTEFLEGTLKFEDENGNPISRDQINITLTDTDGNEVSVTDQSTFQCLAEEYFYDIKAAGYMYKTGNISVSEENKAFTITLQSSSENAWDGFSTSEPSVEENIYQIKDAAELAWFAEYVNNGSASASAVLTADIDLAGYLWTPIGKSSYTGTFDGNGHTVENLYVSGKASYLGLFGNALTGAMIKNIIVKGNISAENTAGGIVGSMAGSTVENCISYVNITAKNSAAGGIAGNVYQASITGCGNYGTITSEGNTIGGIAASATSSMTKTKITNCYNEGTLTGNSYVGGIAGNAGGISITGCYNEGTITGSSLTGGIAGSVSGSTSVYSGGTAEIKGCYNLGTVKAPSKAGGIAGQAGYAAADDCYNAGMISGENNTGALIGALANNNVSGNNLYYLENTVSADSALALGESKSSEELKLAFLDEEYFAGICNGYPALLWQKNVTFHTSKEVGTVTASTCTERGYTTYSCELCEESYRKEFTDALGHDWCEHDGQEENCTDCVYTAPTCTEKGSIIHTCRHENCTETKTDILEATGHTEDSSQTAEKTGYKECVCSICGETYRVWDEERLNHMTLDYPVLTEITLTDGSYKWNYDAENHYFRNENKSVGTTAETTLTVDLAETSKLSFDYGTLSMQSTDKFTFSVGGETIKTFDYSAGNINEHYEIVLEAGKHTVTFQFAISGFWGSSNGAAYFKDLTIQKEIIHEHAFGTVWKTDDTQHWKECECGEKSELADHTFTWVVDKAATTESTGLKHEECICGITRNEETEIPKVATATVYFSISDDDHFVSSDNIGEVMALREMTVPYFDLSAYDLEEYASEDESEVTMLHLFIYALEVYYCGVDPEDAGKGYLNEEGYLGSDALSISGSAGSLFMEMFWDMDLNLNYYLNYEYPLEAAGWGATADRIILHDGDVVTLGHFTSWSFFSDPTSIFNYIQCSDDTIKTTAEQGDQVTLTLYRAGADFTGNYTTAHIKVDYCPEVYYIPLDELNAAGGDVTEWNAIGTASTDGTITLDTSELEAGTYLVAVAGQYGSDYTDEICSTPGGILLTITEKEYVQPDMTLLNAAIAEADGLTAENYTEESWTAFAEALETAKEIAASETADQNAVDAALAALTEAKEALAEKEEKEPADATDDSKDVPVEMYITSAGSTQTGGSTGSAIDGDYSTFWEVAWDIGATNPELLWYQIELEEAVELEALRYYPRSGSNQGSSNGFITDYQVLVSNDGEEWTVVSEGSWEMTTEWKIAEFDSPVTAKYVRLFATGTYADVGNNTNMSIAEIRVKSVEKVDYVPAVKKDTLEVAINKAEALKAADYVDFTAVEEALAAAKAVYANEEAAQEEVDAAAATLNAAVKALVKLATETDKANLKEAIDKAKALNAADYVDFTAVEAALTAAEEVYANEKASQSEVKAATNKLNKAIKALVEVVVEENEVVRLAGSDRYATGMAAADELKSVLGVEKFDTVIIATGKNYADALSGSYLAAVKNAPILLTNGKAANVAELHAYIKENVAVGGTVYILGGTAAVPENVEAIKDAGYKVERISGSSRYETSLKILEAAGITGEELIVATGNNFADSLSASAAGRPIMLVKPNTALTDAQKAVFSKFTQIYVVGGEGVVSKAIETELAAYGTVTRLSGTDRYETSVKVAETFFKDADKALIANGKKFPDGLCGGALAAALGAPLLLTKDGNTTAAAEYVSAQGICSGYVLGGTGAISEETVEAIFGFAETK